MKKQNILMIVENSFPNDVRVRKEANTLSNFYNITVIAYKSGTDKFHEMVNNIEVFRIPKFNLVKLNINNSIFSSLDGYFPKSLFCIHPILCHISWQCMPVLTFIFSFNIFKKLNIIFYRIFLI